MTTGPARALLRRLGLFPDGFSACLSRQPQREAATQCIDGLFTDSERKSMQAMHGRLGDPRDYQALQHFISKRPANAVLTAAAIPWGQLVDPAGSGDGAATERRGPGAGRELVDP